MLQSASDWDDGYHMDIGSTGVALLSRFKRLGELGDLENAISLLENAVKLSQYEAPDKVHHLNNLGTALRIRFQCLGELSDLEHAILALRSALNLTTDGHPAKPACLLNLGDSFISRFQRLGELGDLDDAISSHKAAVNLIPCNDLHKPTCFTSLGNSFKMRFESLGELSDIEDSISSHREANDLAPHSHPDKPVILNNLGTSLFVRFQHRGEFRDLEDAILTLGDALRITPDDHPDKPARLLNLGNFLKTRFDCLYELSDLEAAIALQKDAVEHTPYGHPGRPSRLGSLGNSVTTRFVLLGELSDIEDAIMWHRDALNLTQDDHPAKLGCLNNLGTSLFARFERLGEQCDIEEAISMFKHAVHLVPNSCTDKSTRLNNLGASLQAFYGHFGDPGTLEDAILTLSDAVDSTPNDHCGKPIRLKNFGCSLLARFERLGELKDLEDAISRLQDAISLTPDNHADKLDFVDNLGDALFTRFEHFGEQSDLEQAIRLYSQVATTESGPVSIRLLASQKWMSQARRISHHSLLHACAVSISILPRLAWIGLPFAHRYVELKRGADVAREAAAIALDLGLPETAVEWLEQGRSIVWGELFHLRSSYEDLSSAYPDHARRLQGLCTALEHAGANREKSLSALSETAPSAYRAKDSLQEEAARHRMLAIQRDKVVQEIRRLPGFERFLLHKEFTQLRASARSGPVVILNAAESRCDALIVLADLDHVIHVPLPHLTLKRSTYLRNTLKSFVRQEREGRVVREDISWESVLSPLWECVVKPVLDGLAFTTHGALPRIFWCPTGSFAFLPIHAAGLYDSEHSQPGHKVFDFVVSSYIPTLSILGKSSNFAEVDGNNLRLLAVPQPPSDGQSHLPGVAAELTHIKEVIENSPLACATLSEPSNGTVDEVLSLMKVTDWVHFACHGIQDATNPTNSGLCLADGHRLKLRDIIALSRPGGGLAFLSACQTATGDERLSDEAIHIAAGMLFAGYESVVGTMWSISDRLAPDVARGVYEYLLRNDKRPDHREAAFALYEAIGRLRENGAPFNEWIPFIHIGL